MPPACARILYAAVWLAASAPLGCRGQATPTPSKTLTVEDQWWYINGQDCANIDITSATGYTSVAACRQWCMAYGSACCGAVWNKLDMTTCWLKACGGGYSFTANANRWCNFLPSRLSAAVLATLPTMSRSLSPSASASPLPAPVWALAVDAETGLGAFSSVVGGGAMVWDTDRRGCRCGALRLPGGSYLTLAANAHPPLPAGNAPRTVAAWVNCTGPGNALVVLEWGNANSNNQRSALMGAYGCGNGNWAFVAQFNDVQSGVAACGRGWTHLAYSYDGTTMRVYTNGVLTNSGLPPAGALATPANTSLFIGWNGVITKSAGETYGSCNAAAVPAPALDDLRIWNVALSAGDVQRVYYDSPPCPSVCPTPTQTASFSSSNTSTPSRTGTATATGTPSQTSTRSVAPSGTPTGSRSAAVTVTPTATLSGSNTPTFSVSSTRSVTGGASASGTAAVTATASRSGAATGSSSGTASGTGTGSLSTTLSGTMSGTATGSAAATATATPTRSGSDSGSVTLGASASSSAAATVSASWSATLPPSPSATLTASLSRGASASATASASAALTPSSSATTTSSASADATASPTVPVSPSVAPSAASTVTATVSASLPPSPSPTASTSPTATTSASASASLAAATAANGPTADAAAAAAGSSGTGAIAAGAGAGAVILLAAAAAAVIVMRRRREHRRAPVAATKGGDSSSSSSGGGGGIVRGSANPLLAHQPSFNSGRPAGDSTTGSVRALAFTPSTAGLPAPAAAARAPAVNGDRLLPGWVEVFSKSKQQYYYRHAETGETSWDKPVAAAEKKVAAPVAAVPTTAEAPLPAGWTQCFSRSKQANYWRHEDGRTSWSRPE